MTLVTRDATSLRWTPRSAAEYTALLAGRGISNPILLWMPGDPASGNVPDLIGTFTGLSSAGGGVHYQSPVTGWATKCILLDDGAVAKVVNQDAGLPDISATSALVFAWVGYTGTPGTERSAITLGPSYGTQTAHDIWASSPPKMALAWGGGGSGANTSLTVANASGVHPIILQHNRSATLQVFQTEAETKTHAISTETGKSLALGGDNVSWWFAGGVQYILVALWSGVSAELDTAHRATLIDAHVNGPAVTAIAVTPTPVALAPVATQQLTATATRADTSTFDVTDGTNIPSTWTASWVSDAPSVATVSASGLITAVAVGTAHITRVVTSLGAAAATSNAVTVTVSSGITFVGISVTPAVGQCFIGGTKQFTAIGTKSDTTTQDVTSTAVWSSSNPAAATVAAGLASGLSIGGTIITASIGGHSDTSMLTVLVNAGAAGDLADQQAAMFGEDIWYDVSHPDDQGFADLIVDAGGDWQDVTGIEALRQSLLRRMITSPGEWQTVPEYGVGARQYIKAPMTPSTIAELESRIRSQYLRDDRVESIDSITITPLTGNLPGIYVLVNVIPKGRLRQDVTLPVAITIT